MAAKHTLVKSTKRVSIPKVSLPWNKAVPAVYMALLAGAFILGSLWQKVSLLQNSATNTNAAAAQQAQPQQTADVQVTSDQIKSLFSANLMKFGDANRKVLFVAVEDPSCPYCHIASGLNSALNKQAGSQFTLVADGGTYVAPIPEMRKLVDSGKASFVYVYTPGHGNGEMGTKALLCAYEKGKFWQVHDLLMSAAGYDMLNNTVKNDKTKSAELTNFLKPAMDSAQLKACIDSGKYDSRLTSDTQLAQTLGVTGTPGFFVNTTRFAGAYSYTEMKSAVDAALQ